jgi:hypothetical protein
VGDSIQMHIVHNILCDHWGMHQYPNIPFQFLLEWQIILGMCEVTYLVMVRNIHLSTYNNNIKKKKSIMKIILIIINIASLI